MLSCCDNLFLLLVMVRAEGKGTRIMITKKNNQQPSLKAITNSFSKHLLKIDLDIADPAFRQHGRQLTLESSLRFFLIIYGVLCSTRRIFRKACFSTEIEFMFRHL